MKSGLKQIVLIVLLSLCNVVYSSKSRVCVCVEEIATNLTDPLIIRNAADWTDRLFVGEQKGLIWILNRNGMVNTEPFLNITEKVIDTTNRIDNGLYNLVFHPHFKANGKFFVHYASMRQPANTYDHVALISEFCVLKQNPNTADPSSEKVILEIQQPFPNHNGGEMFFDDYGFLMLTLGDGGGSGDPLGNAQNTSTLYGSMLRIDVDRTYNNKFYAIPPDNPFVDNPEFRPEIYAYGLRNTWRCGKDRGDRKTGKGRGRILCGDVGQERYEEVDLIVKGGNYGWNAREGPACFNEELCGKIGPEEFPVFFYPDASGSRSVIGGEFYRGKLNPRMNGLYIFGDFVSGQLFSLLETSPNKWKGEQLETCSKEKCEKQSFSNTYGRYIRSFGTDESGEIYMVSVANMSDPTSGALYRIRDGNRHCRGVRIRH